MITKIGLYKDSRKKKPWIIRWFGEYDPKTEKQKRYSKAFLTRREAEEFQAQQAVSFKTGDARDRPEQMTLHCFCEDWYKTRKTELRAGSLAHYRYSIERMYQCFGKNMLLSKVTPRHSAKFIADLRPWKQGRNDDGDGKLSNWTRHRILRNCRTMFQSAIDWQLITKNPFASVKAPKLVTTAWHYLTPDEYKMLLNTALSLRYQALYALGYTAGLRLGEMLSLTWQDIDFEMGHVRLENRHETATMPPFYLKDNDARTIPLPKHTLNILAKLQAEAPEEMPYVLLNRVQYENMLIRWKGLKKSRKSWENRLMARSILQSFKRNVRRAGIKTKGKLTIHTLRKCCGQNWANHLPANVTKELMGHSSIATTMKYYSQVDTHHMTKAAAVMDALINDTAQKQSDAKVTPEADFEQNSRKQKA